MKAVPDFRPALLLTRSAEQCARFAGQFRAQMGEDWPVIFSPVLEPEGVPCDIPGDCDVIFTSQNAVHFSCLPGQGRRAWCVGERTARVAREAGFDVVAGPGDGAGLVRVMKEMRPSRPLCHMRGDRVAFQVAEALQKNGFEVCEKVVYRQIPQPLSGEALTALSGVNPVLVPVFSPRSGRILAGQAKNWPGVYLAAISRNCAEACAGIGAQKVEIAPVADAGGVMTALTRLLGVLNAG